MDSKTKRKTRNKNSQSIEVQTIDQSVITPENKCSFCKGSKCCQYITTQIDTPRSIRDFDHLLWQISHFNTHVFKDTDGWFLVINQQCQHLLDNGRCGIYETRPFICREHDNNDCEFDHNYYDGCDFYFDSYSKLDEYCRNRFKTWNKRFEKTK